MKLLSPTRVTALPTRVPLAGSYPAAVALALLALCPFLVLSTAVPLFQPEIIRDLDTTALWVGLAAALANAAYAFGAVASADLIQRAQPRSVYLVCEVVFIAGSLLCALAQGAVAFVLGRVLQGLGTGMLLVAALPPLVTNHGSEKLPLTGAFINLGLFGMVTLGPVIGGLVGSYASWRAPFFGVAVLGMCGFVLAVFAFGRSTPRAPGMGFDFSAIPVAATATVLPFFAVAWLAASSFTAPGFLIPLVVGLAALGILLVRQYRKRRALMPLKMLTHTLPVTGVSTAMVVGAAFTTLLELCIVFLLQVAQRSPVVTGALLATQLLGIVVAAWLFKRMLPTRWLPVLAFCGLGTVATAGVLLSTISTEHAVLLIPLIGLLLGFGAGAGVAPGLFMGGLSVPSKQLGPTFALVELLRAQAAFLVSPILLHLAMQASVLPAGIRTTASITVVFTVACGAALLGVLLLGGARPHAPDLESWLGGDTPAYHSPRLGAALRGPDDNSTR